WSHLERLGGGIGTRGPGETQIETDRRLVRGRIKRLHDALKQVRVHRDLYRQKRKAGGIPVIALVGYTNAGKSTVFNALTQAKTTVQNQVFATLDPLTRRAHLPSGQPILLSDTVGFINKLPLSLVAAFKATLEELEEASVLVHVVDVTHANAAEQAYVVERTLEEMGLARKPTIVALNKIDLAYPEAKTREDIDANLPPLAIELQGPSEGSAVISAKKGWGLNQVLTLAEKHLPTSLGNPPVYHVN
ncbi:GTPase HflX, partial [Dehalococcoidia bacterium]|nr:GTPase HflX [Dehalococcoidia bacterium]